MGDDAAAVRLHLPTLAYEPIALPGQPVHLHAVALHGTDMATMAGAAGTVWHTTDIAGSPPVFTTATGNYADIRALALWPGGLLHAFGGHAQVQALSGTNRMPVHNVYPPKLNGVYFSNGNTGHVVGAGLTARYTTNGGQHWQVVPVGGGPYDLNAVHGNGTHAPLAVGATGKVLTLYGAGFAEATTDPGDDLRAVAMGHSGAAVVVGGNGGNGIYHTRLPGSATWVGPTYVGTGLNAVWSFPPYLLDGGDDPTEDFLLGGNEAHVRLLRHAQTPTPTFTPSWGGTAPGITGDITCLWFHDRLAGFAGTLGDSLYRTDVTAMQLAHGSPFPWKGVPGYNTLNGQTSLANIQLRTIGFSNRHQGFIGGRYNGSPVSYARVITDEGGLYSQRFWYDALGRIVLSQNSEQFGAPEADPPAPQRFSYTLYDDLGRVYEAGELTDGDGADAFRNVPGMVVGGLFKPDVLDPDTLKAWVLTRPRREVTRTWYDEPLSGLALPSGFTQRHLRLRVATTTFEEVDDGDSLTYDHATHYSYDIHGNVADMLQEHPQLAADADMGCPGCAWHRFKRIRYEYDLISGNVKKVSYQPGRPDQFHHRYSYDADNRITKVQTSADNVTWYTDADYFYYPHGPLQRVELGQHKVQGVDYAYTLQGWLKGINSDRLVPESDMGLDGMDDMANANRLIGRDAFGFSLNYFGDTDYQAIDATRWDNTTGTRPFAPMGTTGTLAGAHHPLYNGNIAHTTSSLQPFGGWSGTGQSAQVLAQVYRYDQLNRLKRSQGVTGMANNSWEGVADAVAERYRSEYWYDANGNIDTLARYDQYGAQYDGFKYHYRKAGGRLVQNRLYELHDGADEDDDLVNAGPDEDAEDIAHNTGSFDPEDPDINTAYNYGYDKRGNLIRDAREGITHIDWTVAGKVRGVTKSTGPSLFFAYGAGGHRTMKQVGDPDQGSEGFREHYIRDAQGNIMAIYRYTNNGDASTKLVERPVYGSSRLGSYAKPQEVMGGGLISSQHTAPLVAADQRYELTDHLGNVNTVVSGRLLDGAGAGSQKQAEVLLAHGYEPFGALLPGRNYRQLTGPPPPPETPKGTLVITEFSNGPSQANGSASGECEYVELYVTKCALYPEAEEVDIRGWIVDDNAGNFNSGGCTTGVGINNGHLRFAHVSAWESVPVGTVIVLYNGADNCYDFTIDESGTGPYFINVNSTSLIERTGSGGTPSSSDCDYCGNSYTTATWDPISLGNTADAIQVRCPDCPESEAGFFHGVAYGSGFGGITAGASDLGGAYFSGTGSARTYELTGAGSPGAEANWTRTTAPNGGGTAPASVGVVDAGVIAWLESATLACCGSFEPPVVVQRHGYRFGFNGKENDNEWHGAVGTLQDYGMRAYDTRLGRFFAVDPLTRKYPMLTPYQFASNTPTQAIDLDGLEAMVVVNSQWFLNEIQKAITAGDIDEAERLTWAAVHARFEDGSPAATLTPDPNGVTGFNVFDVNHNPLFGRGDNVLYRGAKRPWVKGGYDWFQLRGLNAKIKVYDKAIEGVKSDIAKAYSAINKIEEDYRIATESIEEGSSGDPGSGIGFGNIFRSAMRNKDIEKQREKIKGYNETLKSLTETKEGLERTRDNIISTNERLEGTGE